MKYVGRAVPVVLLLFGLLTAGSQVHGQEVSELSLRHAVRTESYVAAPEEIAQAVLAPRHRNVALTDLSPDGSHFLNLQGTGPPPLSALARFHYNLAGIEIDPRANRARSLTVRGSTGMELISLEDGRARAIEVPAGLTISNVRWSPDGEQIAYFAHREDATHIYIADVERGRSRRLTRRPVLATLATTFEWTSDGEYIVTVLVPQRRGAEPVAPFPPTEPKVRITLEGRSLHRTYPSLLETPHDARLLQYHTTGQLARITVRNGRVELVGEPAMIRSADPSPDGEYVRVRRMEPPFSYIVPASRFGSADELWDWEGNLVAELARQQLNEGGAPPRDPDADAADAEQAEANRRSISWRPDGQGLGFLQLEPERTDGESRKDRVMQWLPPYGPNDVRIVYESENALSAVSYSSEPDHLIFITERSGSRQFAVFLAQPESKYRIQGGDLMTKPGPHGLNVVRTSSDWRHVYISGTDRSEDRFIEEAPRPWVDRLEIATGERQRLFQSQPDVFEQVRLALDDDFRRFITTRETATTVPNSYLRDRDRSSFRRLTDNTDFTPDLTNAPTYDIQVTRADSISFWVRVRMPPEWTPGTRLPALFWFYPREYANQTAYLRAKRNHNINAFPSLGPRSMDILLRAGYAVVFPDVPIIGPAGRMNDNYVRDLKSSLEAVVNELDTRGLIDRDRLAAGGHSYGAFSTVNAMVHTDLFRAGIAGNGAYNRTLTPAGFQSERRTLWTARETYLEMSPLLYANRLNGALLMYVGEQDQNVGTFPINSYRLFHALNALGKAAAMYVYPFEAHGPVAQETLLDMWARWIAWLDHYVRNAPPTGEPERPGAGQASPQIGR